MPLILTRTTAEAAMEHHHRPMLGYPVAAIAVMRFAMHMPAYHGPSAEEKTSSNASRNTMASISMSRGVKAAGLRAVFLSIKWSVISILRRAKASATATSTYMIWRYTLQTKATIPLPIIFIIFASDRNFQIKLPRNLETKYFRAHPR